MHIQIVGAAVNAAVMAYYLADVGHTVSWLIADEQIARDVRQNHLLFDDHDISQALYRKMEQQQLQLGSDHKASICVLALTAEQYLQFATIQPLLSWANYALVVNYSHLGLGETENLQQRLNCQNMVYIPDFLQEGNLIRSFLTQGLIVGCEPRQSVKDLVQEMFRPIFPLFTQYNFMTIAAAEFTKLSISGFLATKVSYMNDLANVAETLGIDIEEVRIAMSTDPRIGTQYLFPGCGFGGGNLTRDVLTLKHTIQSTRNSNGLLDKIWDINQYQKEIIFRKLWKLFDNNLQGKVIAFWGAAFKPNTGSLAQAPILNILEACWAQGAITQVHDPRALPHLAELYPNQPLLRLCEDQYQATEQAEALCLVTEWKNYYSPDYVQLRQRMKGYHLIDGRNIYNPKYVKQQGFHYIGIGRVGV